MYTCQDAILLEIMCHGSIVIYKLTGVLSFLYLQRKQLQALKALKPEKEPVKEKPVKRRMYIVFLQ